MAARLLVAALAATVVASPLPLPALLARDSPYDISTPINSSLPNVTIFATGGTIASQGTTNTQTTGYQLGLGVSQLISAVPEILNISNINGIQISQVDSGSVNKTILLALAHAINTELSKPEISGVVVTHGTDTLEETAFFLDLVVNSSKPVIIVGAMRPATALSADGPLNLFQAVTLAISPNARDRGAMITLNDRIGSAFYTTKNNANSLDTFFSTEAGQLGFFIDQVPYFYYAPAKPIGLVSYDISNLTDLPTVNILYAHQDMDPTYFAKSLPEADGLVVAGVGAGGFSRVASIAAETLYNATQKSFPIVASHRSADGFVPASEGDFVVASGFFNPQKARILLQLSLAVGDSLDKVRSVFALSYPMP